METVERALKEKYSRIVTVLVDSRDRDHVRFPHPHEYRVRLPKPLHYVQAGWVASCEMPVSFFVFSEKKGNTRMRVGYDQNEPQWIQIPDGNYTFESMRAALRAALVTAFPSANFDVSFDDVAATFSFSNDQSAPITVVSENDPENPTLAWILGFRGQETFEGPAGKIVTPNPASLFNESYILLDLPGLGRIHETGIYGSGGFESTETFAKIPLDRLTSEYSFFNKPITFNDLELPVESMHELHVRWRFHDGSPVNFHGLNHAFTLQLIVSDVG